MAHKDALQLCPYGNCGRQRETIKCKSIFIDADTPQDYETADAVPISLRCLMRIAYSSISRRCWKQCIKFTDIKGRRL